MVGGDVRMGAADNVVLLEPVLIDAAQDAQAPESRARVEDVVDDSLRGDKNLSIN